MRALWEGFGDSGIVVSDDAKARIHTDVSPTLHLHRRWTSVDPTLQVSLPSHDFQSSLQTAIQSHGFLLIGFGVEDTKCGQYVSHLCATHSSDAIQRLNEMLLCMESQPLRWSTNGAMPTCLLNLVDNGPGANPAACSSQLMGALLWWLLQLHILTQFSFEPYGSKFNLVERLHVVADFAIAGPVIPSTDLNAALDMVTHRLNSAVYGGQPVHAYSWTHEQDFTFFGPELRVYIGGSATTRRKMLNEVITLTPRLRHLLQKLGVQAPSAGPSFKQLQDLIDTHGTKGEHFFTLQRCVSQDCTCARMRPQQIANLHDKTLLQPVPSLDGKHYIDIRTRAHLPAEGPWSIVDSFLPTRLAARALCEPNCEEQLKAWSLLSDDLWNDALAHARKQTYNRVDNQFDPAEDGMCNICGDFFAAADLSHCSSCYSNYCDNCWLHAHDKHPYTLHQRSAAIHLASEENWEEITRLVESGDDSRLRSFTIAQLKAMLRRNKIPIPPKSIRKDDIIEICKAHLRQLK